MCYVTAYGYGLSEELRGGGPAPIGGAKANLSEALTAVSQRQNLRKSISFFAVL
jgi:hypothetical protein